MKSLTINLSDSIADRLNNLPDEERQRIEKLLANVLEDLFRKKASHQLFLILDRVSAEAKQIGMTIEKLAEIMEWDDQTIKNLFGEKVEAR